MGEDGLRGSERIREAGGQVIVQDEASSSVWGMPGVVAKSGFANKIVPLNDIAGEIIKRVQQVQVKKNTSSLKLATCR